MNDQTPPARAPDAEILGGPVDFQFWLRHPHVASVVQDRDDEGQDRYRLWLLPAANDRATELTKWAGPNRPETEPDVRFENAGGAPPPWFWNAHPYIIDYTLEYDPDDGGNWWVEAWIRGA